MRSTSRLLLCFMIVLTACTAFAGPNTISGTIFQNVVDPGNANDPANWNTSRPYATFFSSAIKYDSRATGYTPAAFLNNPGFTSFNLFDPNADFNNSAIVLTGMQWLHPGANNFFVTHDDGVYLSLPSVGFTLDLSGPSAPDTTYFTVTNPGAAGLYAFTLNYAECCGQPAVLITNMGAVPEPGTLLMLGSGVLGLMGALRRKLSM